MTAFRWALREIRYRPVYAALFSLSMAVGTASLMALAGVSGVVKATVDAQAKELWAADISVKGSEVLLDEMEPWARSRWAGASVARSVETLSMARHRASRTAGQITVSAVSANYPLYGKITTGSGRPFHSVLTPGSIVVGERLLKGWGLAVGDRLTIGTTDLSIADTVVERTDVATSFFELSPTVFLLLDDLKRTGVLGPGSRAVNTLYLNVPPGTEVGASLAEVKARASSETTEVGSWSTDNPGVFKAIQRTLLYLDFLALLTLTLGGVGAATALSAALNAGRKSVAMAFALGAPRGFVYRGWGAWVCGLSAVGIGLGALLSRALAALLLSVFGNLLPGGLLPEFPLGGLVRAGAVGLGASLMFAFWPLSALGSVAPNAIFSEDVPPLPLRRRRWTAAVGGAVFFVGLAWAHLGRFLPALQYVAVLGGGAAVGGGIVRGVLGAFRWGLSRSSSTSIRLAARGLARPGNLNNASVFSVALSLSVLLTLALLERNLFGQLVERFPTDAPNVFFINLDPAQSAAFTRLLERPAVRLFPLIRGRVVAVNGVPVQTVNRRGTGQGDRLTREFGFTFGNDLLPTDRVVDGPGLWDPSVAGPQVSVFDEYRKRFGLRRGDRIAVSVLGRRFEATVSSFRSINQSVRQPFFYFFFRPGLLEAVPHTLMAGASVPKGDLPALQNRLAERLPNVTVIDLSDVAAITGRLVRRLSRVVGVLGGFGLSSGIVLLLSGVLASLASRTRESALFRAVGASRGNIVRVALIEYALVAAASVAAAWAMGGMAAGLLLRRWFDLRMEWFPLSTGLLLGGTAAGMVFLSWFATRSALTSSPMDVLRHE